MQSESQAEISVWMKNKDVEIQPLKVILWRIKNVGRMGEDVNGRFDGPGGRYTLKWKDALSKFPPTILEVFSEGNPLGSLVSVLTLLDTATLQNFFRSVFYLHISHTDAHFSDILFLLTQMSSLVAFSYSKSKALDDNDFNQLISSLSSVQIRAIDISGSCHASEINRFIQNLNVELIRFCASPGISVKSFLKTTAISSTVRFVVAQGLNFSTESDGLTFLKNAKTVFPCMKSLYWDWDMLDPHVEFSDRTKTCISLMVELYRELQMNMLAILFYSPTLETREAVMAIFHYFETFVLPNITLRKLRTQGLQFADCGENFALLMVGTFDGIQRLEKIICDDQITSPDLRHFLYVLDPSLKIYKANATFEFLGFNV